MTDATDIQNIAARLGFTSAPTVDDSMVDTAWLARLPLAFARNNLLLPLREEDGRLLVAIGEPTNLLALDELQGALGLPVQGLVVPRDEVLAAINRLYARQAGSAQEVV